MPEPFKNLFNHAVIGEMAGYIGEAWTEFDSQGFVAAAGKDLESLELKQRSDQICKALEQFLPPDFDQAGKVLLTTLNADTQQAFARKETSPGLSGFAVMPMTYYVGRNGLSHFDLAMTLFRELTRRFSSEFGIRYFLLAEPERTLARLKEWTRDDDQHVRRLVSEGTRPRLPWAMQLPAFIANPAPLLELLEALKDDPEEYVRRSVANNLNDIAKDHPNLVAGIAADWLKDASVERQKLVKHACRTLIKQGHKPTLAALGYGEPQVEVGYFEILTPEVEFGTALKFKLALASSSKHEQPLIIDYAVHHVKANGKTTSKVFKWKTIALNAGAQHTAERKHPMRNITTRSYYPGTHRVEILVNGVSLACGQFELLMQD